MSIEKSRTDAWEGSPGILTLVVMSLLAALAVPFAVMISIFESIKKYFRS